MSHSFGIDRIRDYYERHTRTFIAYGEGGSLGAMHRAIVTPGTTGKISAFRFVEDAIIAVARRLRPADETLRVVDLGCGVGGSLCYIADHLAVTGVGITLSPTQAALGRQRIAAAGRASQLTILEGDFTTMAAAAGPADLAFAIESFVHAPDVPRFFDQCAQLVRPGGALIICDDFRRGTDDPQATSAIERFRRGWHVNTLLEPEELRASAAAAGFSHESTTDLSAYVDIGRTRDRIVDLVAAPLHRLPRRWSWLDPWLGGSALQTCLRHGWLGYDLVVFRRAS